MAVSLRTPGSPVRVFLLDDHEIVRHGVRMLLEADPGITVVGDAATVAEALPAILALRPDVCVLDARLSDGSGIEVCRAVRAADPAIRTLVLTSHGDADVVSAAIMAGAAGFVLKRISATSLVSGVRMVADGHSLIDPEVAAHVVRRQDPPPAIGDVVGSLTPQQARILELIAGGLTNRQIAERLFLAEKTVKNHVTALLAKLGVEHRTQAAVLALRLLQGA